MKLLLDIGNSRIKAALSVGGHLTTVDYSPDLYQQYPIKQLTYASVRYAKRIAPIISDAHQAKVKIVEVTTSPEKFGVVCGYDNFETLGIDRWLGVLAADREYPQQNVIIVDTGTATTVDFLNAEQQHLGGWILPGFDLMTHAITQYTDKVFDDQATAYLYDVGNSTPKALKYGCLAAQCGVVQQAVQFFKGEFRLVITGGASGLLLPHLIEYQAIDQPLLVFKGLDRF